MSRRDGAFIKQTRIAEMKRHIMQQLPNPVHVSRILTWAEVSLGLSGETAQHYLDLIVEAEGWLVNDGKIVVSLVGEIPPAQV